MLLHAAEFGASHLVAGRLLIHLAGKPLLYSCRRADIGSTRAARQAGARQAANATTSRHTPTVARFVASSGLVAKSIDRINRVSPIAPPTPRAIPTRTGTEPPPTTNRTKSPRDAPSAARTPSACVRPAVTKESTP